MALVGGSARRQRTRLLLWRSTNLVVVGSNSCPLCWKVSSLECGAPNYLLSSVRNSHLNSELSANVHRINKANYHRIERFRSLTDPTGWLLQMGMTRRNSYKHSSTQSRKIQAIIKHPEYNNSSLYNNDIGAFCCRSIHSTAIDPCRIISCARSEELTWKGSHED